MSDVNPTFGLYKIKMMDKIGQGSFGVVYHGNHIKKGFQIAAKQCDLRNEKSGVDAMREIKHFQKLQRHPHIVKFHDFFYKNRAFWMILEFCDEGDLQQYFKKSKPLKPLLNEQLNIMFQTASAISFMHNQKNMVVHRDIKPGNILLMRSGTNIIVKVTDFGLSTAIEAPDPGKSMMMSTTAGSPGFMAPEFFMVTKKYDKSIDIFSLGLVFLAMIIFKPEQEHLTPPLMKKGMFIPIGQHMVTLNAYGVPIPDLIQVTGEESQTLKNLKAIVGKMIKYNPNERCRIEEVEDTIASLGGSTPCKLPDLHTPEQVDSSEILQTESKDTGHTESTPQLGDSSITVNNYRDASSHLSDEGDLDEASQAAAGGSKTSDGSGLSSKNVSTNSDSDSDNDEGGIGFRMMKRVVDQALKDRFDIDDEVLQAMMKDLPFEELLGRCIKTDPAVDGFEVGEKVLILSDKDKVEALQDGYGGWHRQMAKYIGKAGIVRGKVNTMIKVTHDDSQSIHYNPKALVKTGEKPYGDDDGPLTTFANEESVNAVKAKFKRYDVVKLPDDPDLIRCLQENHCGWNKDMEKSIGVKGMVSRVNDNGYVFVEFVIGDDWTLNPELLIKVDMSVKEIETGDYVVVGADSSITRKLQKHLGVWEKGMEKLMGHPGVVRKVGRKTITVDSGPHSYRWHPKMVTLIATGEEMMAGILRKNMSL